MFDYTFYWSVVWGKLPTLLNGASITIEVTALSMLIGTAIALPLALLRRTPGNYGYRFATAWVEISRNTPALFQIYMAYFGLGAIGINISGYVALLGALSFNNAGYLAEIFRGGINAVPRTQYSSARSLGMTATQAYMRVVFPQVFTIVFLPYVNQLSWAMLNSSLGSMIGVDELTGATEVAQSESFRTFEFFIVTAGIYYAISKIIALAARVIIHHRVKEE